MEAAEAESIAAEEEAEAEYREALAADLDLFASDWLKIRTKGGAIQPLVFNDAQRFLHDKIERQRALIGMVRALILKGRQQGCSTYVEARFYHWVIHGRGKRAFILTHEDEATRNIFEIAKRFHDHNAPEMQPQTDTSNAKELRFGKMDSGYRVATAGKVGAGRSATLQYFHGSEVAFWPNDETHVAGAMQAVADGSDTEIILESTSNGPRGLFFKMWQQAERGEGDYVPIFIPWFWQREYRRKPGPDFKTTSEEQEYARKHGLDDAQLCWRRAKILELHGVWHFRREYPATPAEAFRAESPGALWSRALIDEMRVDAKDVPPLIRLAVSLDPATTSKKTSDDWGNIWGGKAPNGHVYVVGDETAKLKPDDAARRAINIIREQKGNEIVYESNQGGDMVPTIIKLICKALEVPTIRCVGVHASKAKRARAEPVHTLCVDGKVHIVGSLAALEDELCTWNASKESESPNRLDAFVWLVYHYLIQGMYEAAAPAEEEEQESRWAV